MASDSEACCDEDPNFAVICAFFEKFGELIGITDIDFCELQSMLENFYEVSPFLIELHVKLLRKIRKSVKPDKWEKQLINFCHTFSSSDAWELERFGYKQAKLSSKIRALKELLEAQFDQNSKFKVEINKITSKDLRSQPLGRDKLGHAYWFHSDANYQIRVYKEDLDDEKWTLVAKDRTGLVSLITSLSDGDVKPSSDSAGNEDSNSLSEKPIIDTGQQDSDSKKTSDEEILEKDVDEQKLDTVEVAKEESTEPTKEDKSEEEEAKVEPKATLKRARDKEEDEDDNQKLKVKTSDEQDEKKEGEEENPIIGETTEDPPLKIQGEGSGAENESPPIIVGEVIEEKIMWFFGNGSGAECLAGNQSGDEKSNGPTTETKTEKDEIDTGKPEEKLDNKAEVSKTGKAEEAESEKKGFEDEKTEISNDSVENKPIEEPVCTKKVAYVCGEEKDDGDVVENGSIEEEDPLMIGTDKNAKAAQDSDVDSTEKVESDAGQKKKRGRPKKSSKTTNIDEKSNSTSSFPNSPNLSTGENSVISIPDSNDPLAVSSNEAAEPEKNDEAATEKTLTSLSFDFKESPDASPKPNKPSPMRAVRKRGLETVPPKPQEEDETGKRMKLKGRRPIDTALRKSVEQRIEQLHGSSSDSKDSEEEKRTKKPGRKKKGDKMVVINRNPEKKNSRILSGLGIPLDDDFLNDRPQLRQSRRIAQLKIREQSLTKIQADKEEKRKDKEHDKKKPKISSDSESEEKPEKVKKKKKEKLPSQMFNEKKPWQSSSEDSEDAEEEEEEIIEEEDDVPLGPLKSDHEFSPESEEDDEEWQPMKRARTARKESDIEEGDDLPCQKCLKSDHPEWILLCDKCDNGWHCSCLRPPLLSIPEGDWFCPPCEHIILLEKLQEKLIEYDKKLNKKEIEDRRKERLAYVGISLNNVLPNAPKEEHRKKKRRHEEEEEFSESEEESDESEDSYSDEPIYQLRQRRQTKSYKFNEYDDLIKDAIGEETDKPEDTAGNLGRGKDIQTIVKGMEEEEKKAKEGDEERPKANLKKMLRKKHRKLNSLDFDSEEEDISDEDFKGSTGDDDEEEEDYEEGSEDSDDYVGRKRRKNAPTRRSTRARTRRYDSDFIDDDSDDAPQRKKKKSIWDESETEVSENSDYGTRKKPKKKKNRDGSAAERKSKNRPRIKYGGLTSSDEEDLGRGRRTRGKKTTYVDTLGSDTDEGETVVKKNPRRIESDDEDFVANEEDEVDEDKDSEEKVIEEDEDDGESDEDDRSSKPRLIVPKIYIKKPLGNKKANGPGAKSDTGIESAEGILENSTRLEAPEKESIEKTTRLDFQSGNGKTEESGISDVKQLPSKRPRNIHQPIVSNVTSLIKNDADNDDLSEPPGIALHFSEDYNSNGSKSASLDGSPKKRRGRGPTKKKLEDIMVKTGNSSSPGKKLPEPAIEIAAPPQPFSQAQPTPSVITRMLQAKPGVAMFPVGRIRPKQFATMKDEDSDENSPKNSPASSPMAPNQYMPGGPRGPPIPAYPPPLNMNHYPRGPPLPYPRPPLIPYPPPTSTNGGPYPPVSNGPYPQPYPPTNGPVAPQEEYYAGYPPPVPPPRPEEEVERGEGEYEGLAAQDADYSEGQSEPPAEREKSEEAESGGEFAGLASYFSSQREDDLDS